MASALGTVRATAEADAAQRRGQPDEAARQQALASGYRAMHDGYRDREATFAAVMADRADWDAATRHQRTWPSPPTPTSAAATPPATTRRCAPPNLRTLPKPGATASPSRRGSRSPNRPSGSRT